MKVALTAMLKKTPAGAVDELTHQAATPKAFWNDESDMDTPRPNKQITFDGDHDHYLAYVSIGTNGANLETLIERCTEHEGMSGFPILWAQPGANGTGLITAETTYFRSINLVSSIFSNPSPDYNVSGIIQALVRGQAQLAPNVSVIGTWKKAIVIETPDMPAYYVLCTMYNGDNSDAAPLGWREHPAFKGLMLWNDDPSSNPIVGVNAQWRRYLGMGVWNRDAGAVAYIKSDNGSTWAEPTIN